MDFLDWFQKLNPHPNPERVSTPPSALYHMCRIPTIRPYTETGTVNGLAFGVRSTETGLRNQIHTRRDRERRRLRRPFHTYSKKEVHTKETVPSPSAPGPPSAVTSYMPPLDVRKPRQRSA